jgi:hypothetical protein
LQLRLDARWETCTNSPWPPRRGSTFKLRIGLRRLTRARSLPKTS